MAVTGHFVDANLLLLLTVGRAGREFIAKHSRLSGYAPEDYDALTGLLGAGKTVLATPHVLTETSNLLRRHREPERSLFATVFRELVHESREVMVAGAAAADNPAYLRLGLTDAALLEAISPDTPLVTADARLFAAALQSGHGAAILFERVRHP